jgi:hypothetical protein
MAVDLNQAQEQGSGSGPIPEDSIVIVTTEIRPPKAGKEGTTHPLFCKSSTSEYEFLDFEFTVVSTKFKDRKIWQNFMLSFVGAATEKSNQAISISMRTLRAMVESHRKISPKDASHAATTARVINDFSDLNYMMFPVVVGCEWGKPGNDGKRYLNNSIKRIVTPDDERFAKVFADPEGAILSDKPLPSEPASAAPAAGAAKPAWAAPVAAKTPAPAAQTTLPGTSAPKPAWAR